MYQGLSKVLESTPNLKDGIASANVSINDNGIGEFSEGVVRCVIPVVLSNNSNKLMVHMYVVKNTTIFLIVRLLLIRYNYMFRPSMLAIFRLHMKHLMISYLYT